METTGIIGVIMGYIYIYERRRKLDTAREPWVLGFRD